MSDNVMPINKAALQRLDACVGHLTRQQYKTLKGQILAGNGEAALKGLQKILRRRKADIEKRKKVRL